MSKQKILVCTKGKSCRKLGAKRLFCAFESRIEELGLAGSIGLEKTDCLGYCEQGPTVRVKPDNVWYGGVGPSDCLEILGSVGRKDPVRRLRLKKG